jgi:DnaJ-class molecular chaperone|tara:strand:- start:1138 stop:1353 length:216 start_codon:yes stop_codon:yes gene_type:complete
MGKVIKIAKHKCVCPVCEGNGYIRVSTGDTSLDFRDNSQVKQCFKCKSEGELEIEEPTIEELEAMGSNRLQ